MNSDHRRPRPRSAIRDRQLEIRRFPRKTRSPARRSPPSPAQPEHRGKKRRTPTLRASPPNSEERGVISSRGLTRGTDVRLTSISQASFVPCLGIPSLDRNPRLWIGLASFRGIPHPGLLQAQSSGARTLARARAARALGRRAWFSSSSSGASARAQKSLTGLLAALTRRALRAAQPLLFSRGLRPPMLRFARPPAVAPATAASARARVSNRGQKLLGASTSLGFRLSASPPHAQRAPRSPWSGGFSEPSCDLLPDYLTRWGWRGPV